MPTSAPISAQSVINIPQFLWIWEFCLRNAILNVTSQSVSGADVSIELATLLLHQKPKPCQSTLFEHNEAWWYKNQDAGMLFI